ncbi:hypothetical protein [Bosea sp. BH3]|uniref:hypothetical protein n=1 Tax=Bosea sp. BH3 TaxID=2871701 RepID=UPI0021CB2CF7|nr:hypothetical protein [Bosea sp. BH3]MCU4181787.1 hypothetical protein [Bosea sp. BH3]
MTDQSSPKKPRSILLPTYGYLSPEQRQEGAALTAPMRRPGANPNWPHLSIDPPYVGPPAPRHPRVVAWIDKHHFEPVPEKPMKRPVLRKEVFKIYQAIAFAMRHHGVVLNTHLTIAWGYLGVSDGEQAAWMLTRFNNEAAKWLKVGYIPSVQRRRFGQRASAESSEHFYVYVHEWGRRYGLHTHELAFIPPAKRQAFEAWAEACLARLCGRKYIPAQALKITGRVRAAEYERVWLCWKWFRYITKTLDPEYRIRCADGSPVVVRELFHPKAFYEGAMVNCEQLASGSRNIWTQAQVRAGFVARLYQPDVTDIYDGAEMDEHRWARMQAAEDARRAEFIRGLATLNL